MTLDPRLAVCAGFIDENARVADIGTDHGLLPISLVLSGRAKSAVAADIREGPLNSARENVRKYGLSDKIELCLSDGLKNIPPDGITHIVAAGMGGETIVSIISCCGWAKNCVLVVQPMTRPEELRRYLYSAGWEITEEKAAVSGKFVYTAMKCVFTGKTTAATLRQVYAGKLDPCDENSKLYLKNKIASLEKSGRAKLNAGDVSGRQDMQAAAELAKLLDP